MITKKRIFAVLVMAGLTLGSGAAGIFAGGGKQAARSTDELVV